MNPGNRDHPSRLPLLSTEREQQLRMTIRAEWRSLDIFLGHSRRDQLLAIRFDQIEKDSFGQLTVPRCTSSKKQQGVFFPHGIGVFHFTEQGGSIGELRFELRSDLFANFIAAALDSRSDRSPNVPRATAKIADHLSNALLDNALHSAAPTGVKNSNGALFHIDHHQRNAVCRLNGDQETGSRRYESITNEMLGWNRIYGVNQVGMNLSQGNQRPERIAFALGLCSAHGSDLPKKKAAVPLY